MPIRRILISIISTIPYLVPRAHAQNPATAPSGGLLQCTSDATCHAAFPVVKPNCAPDGFCGDAGARCTTQSQCYDNCGLDGICGGRSAYCDTADHSNYMAYKCNIGLSCVINKCLPDTPQPSAKRQRRHQQIALAQRCRIGYELCSSKSDTDGNNPDGTVMQHDRSSCINPLDNIEFCGGCTAGGPGMDCSSIQDTDVVACQNGQCRVLTCMAGFTVTSNGDACIRSGRVI